MNNKIFFSSRLFVKGGLSLIWINTFSCGRCILFGGVS